MNKRTFAGIGIILIMTIFACYWIRWLTLHDFVVSIDHGNLIFEDYLLFYRITAQNVFSAKPAAPGYFYSAFFAILISPLGKISAARATLLWGVAQITLAALLGIASGWKSLGLSRTQRIVFILIFMTSFPLLHNFKWGQVSTLITLCILAAMWTYLGKHPIFSGILLAFAVSIKYYPLIFVIYPLLKRDYKFLAAFAVSVLVFFCVIPSLIMGPREWIAFEKDIVAHIADADFSRDVNSLYFGHAVPRMLEVESAETMRWLPTLLKAVGGLVFLSNIGYVWRAQQEKTRDSVLLSTGILFLSIPFIMQTSWPHYFVYLPFCQAVAFSRVQASRPAKWGSILAFTLITLSIMISSIFVFELFPGWIEYNDKGMLFVSDLLLMLAYYIALGQKLHSP